jgi:hypothetical protein
MGVHQVYDLQAISVVAFGLFWILACFTSCFIVWSSTKRRPNQEEAAAIEATDPHRAARYGGRVPVTRLAGIRPSRDDR